MMSVQTTFDKNIDEVREHVRDALEKLSSSLYSETWGKDEIENSRILELKRVLRLLDDAHTILK